MGTRDVGAGSSIILSMAEVEGTVWVYRRTVELSPTPGNRSCRPGHRWPIGPYRLLSLTRLLLQGPQKLNLTPEVEQSPEWAKGPRSQRKEKLENPRIDSSSYQGLAKYSTWTKPGPATSYGMTFKISHTILVSNGWKTGRKRTHQMLYNMSCLLLSLCIYHLTLSLQQPCCKEVPVVILQSGRLRLLDGLSS